MANEFTARNGIIAKNNSTISGSLSTGFRTQAIGNYSHAEGSNTTAGGSESHAEGAGTTTHVDFSHAEGSGTITNGLASHAEGLNTITNGIASHAEGDSTNTTNDGLYSHAEGRFTTANGVASHAEGSETTAYGYSSHAEGLNTIASGSYSHAEGYGTITDAEYQHAQGSWNIVSSIPSAFILGNGDENTRSNLIFAAGNRVEITGSLSVTQGITGSLIGTASWATNAINATSATTASFAVSASFATNASQAQTASFVNTLSQNVLITGSLSVSGSLRVSSSLTALTNGFVGVGTNTPISMLHLGNGSGTTLGDLTTPVITFNTLNNGVYLDSNRLFFKAGGAFNFGIDSTGVLGNQFRINGAASNNVTTPIFVPSRLSLGPNSGFGGNNAGDVCLITSGSTRLRINFNGDLGFFGVTPVARQTLGAATAGATYGTNEQTMLQKVYDALRNYGLAT